MNVSEISKNALFVSLLSLGAAQAFSAQDAERIPREMNQISENIAAEELKKTRAELSVAAAQSASAKISVELALVGAESLEALERELTELSRAETLSEEEAARAKELLATRKSIESIKAAAASARKALREKVQLMQAEIAGEEKLSEIKEELLRAELREQFLAAGVSLAQVDASVQKYIDLEKQLSEKRAPRGKKSKKTCASCARKPRGITPWLKDSNSPAKSAKKSRNCRKTAFLFRKRRRARGNNCGSNTKRKRRKP